MARAIEEASPGSVDALAVLGDASVEIGNYADADAAFQDLAIKAPDEPSVLARLAHMAELKGRDGQALQLLRRAADKELGEEGNGESAAWYQTRIGTLLYRTGNLDEASKSFEAALECWSRQRRSRSHFSVGRRSRRIPTKCWRPRRSPRA